MSRQYISLCILAGLLLPLGACNAFKDVDAVIKQDPAANNNASNNAPINNNPANNNPANNNPNNPANNNPNNPVNNNPNNPVNNNPNNPVNNNPVCSPTCTEAEEGDRRCAGGAIERCAEDAAGCLMWQVEEACGANQACDDGGEDAECVCVNGEECPALDATCLDATTRQVCNVDADGCAVFEGDACDSGAVCDMGNGACVQTCEDDSTCPGGIVGEGRCLNGTCYAPCGAAGACGDGEVCADGVCVAVCDDDAPLCRTQETCVEPEGSDVARCEPTCEPHADHEPDGAGASREDALDLSDGQSVEARICQGSGVWLRVPDRFAGDRLELSFLSGAHLDALEVEVIESSAATSRSLSPTAPGETLFWDVTSDGDVFLHLIFEDAPTDAFWIDVELGVEIVSACEGASPLILNEPRELTAATPLALSRLICPMQEVWVQTEVLDRAQLIFRGTAQGALQVALGQEPQLPIWESGIAQEERTLQVRRLEAGPLYVRFTNPTPSPIRVDSSLTLATADACADAYSNTQSPVDAPWISRGTTRAVVCEGRPDIFRIAPPPGMLADMGMEPLLRVRLSAANLKLEWSTDPSAEDTWVNIPASGYDLSALRMSGGPWGDQPLYLRVTRLANAPSTNITYDLLLNSNIAAPMNEMDDLNMATAAQPIQLNGQVQGHLSNVKPTDHFTLAPEDAGLASFQVRTPDAVLAGIQVEVDDVNGRPLIRRLVGGEETRVAFPTTAPGPYRVRLSAAQRDSDGLLMHYTITPEPELSCNDETLLPAGGVSRAWAELGQTHTPRGRPIGTLCPQEQSRMELEVQGLNELNAVLHKINAEPRRLAWSLEGPGCGATDRTVWVGSTSQALDVSLGARCGADEESLLTAGTYTLRLGNPDGEALFLNASAVERRDLNNPNGPCPEVFDGPEDLFNDRLFSAEVAPAGQLLVPGSPVSGSLGFCGEYGDGVDAYAFYVPTSGTAMPIHLNWIGEPQGTPVAWSLTDEAGEYVADSRDEANDPADGPSRYVTLDQGWYTLHIGLPDGYVSTDTTASAWYSVSVGEVVAAEPPACSGADMLTEYDHDAFLMQFNNPSAQLFSPMLPPMGSLPVLGEACAFDLDMAHINVNPNHDVRAILTPTIEEAAPLMGLDVYQALTPDSLDSPVDFDFTQEYDDAAGRSVYTPAVVYWHDNTNLPKGHLLRAYTVGAANAAYTLNIADLDCADQNTEAPSPSSMTGNNAPATARTFGSGPDQPVLGTLCSAGRDSVDWLKHTHSGGNPVTLMAKLRFENLPGVRELTFQVYADPSLPPATSSLLSCYGAGMEVCPSGQECCLQTPVTLVSGQSVHFSVRRSAAGQGESAGVRYSMTLE